MFLKQMMSRYVIYGVFACLIYIFSWYYISVFCHIYKSSTIEWIKGFFISLIIDFVIVALLFPLIMAIVREIIKINDKNKGSRLM